MIVCLCYLSFFDSDDVGTCSILRPSFTSKKRISECKVVIWVFFVLAESADFKMVSGDY